MKKLLSIILCLCMILSIFPAMFVYADVPEEMTFSYAYDVQRSPAIPTEIGGKVTVSGFQKPLKYGSSDSGSVMQYEDSKGDWKLTEVGNYGSIDKVLPLPTIYLNSIVKTVAQNCGIADVSSVVIHKLTDGNGKLVGYGVVLCVDEAKGQALFLCDLYNEQGAGFFLSKSEVTSKSITIGEGATEQSFTNSGSETSVSGGSKPDEDFTSENIPQNVRSIYGEFAKYAKYTPYSDRVSVPIEPMRRRESIADYMPAPPEFQTKKRPAELPLVGRGMLHIGDEGKQGVVKAYFSPTRGGNGRGHLINELVQIGLYYNGPEPNGSDDSFVNNVASYYYTDSPVDIIAYNDDWVAVWDEGAWTDYIFASGGCNYLYHGRYIKPGVYYYPRDNVYILDAKNNSPKPTSSTVGTATCLLAIKTAPESENYIKSGVYKTNQSFQVTNEEPINGHYQVYYAGGLYYVNATWVNLKKKGVEKPLINYTGKLETSEKSISIYDRPNETGNLIGKGKTGMALEILDTNASSEYAKIWFSSKECYIKKSYIKNAIPTAGNMQAMGYVKPIGKIVTDTPWADYGTGFYMTAANGELEMVGVLGRNTEVYVYGVDHYEEYDEGSGLNAKFKVIYEGYPGYILADGRKDRLCFTYYEGFLNTFQTTAKTQTIIIDGEKHDILACNIKDNNYFKIRDIAMLLSGSAKSFEVEWDAGAGCINMKSAFDYTPAGGELAKGDGSQKTAVASDAMLTYDGLIVDAACYNIDGNNYFKLRDITDALDCRVEWNERTQQIEISTMTPAKEDPNEIKG